MNLFSIFWNKSFDKMVNYPKRLVAQASHIPVKNETLFKKKYFRNRVDLVDEHSETLNGTRVQRTSYSLRSNCVEKS